MLLVYMLILLLFACTPIDTGEVTLVPTPESETESSVQETASSSELAEVPTVQPEIHIVQTGETLGAIAKKYDVTVEMLVATNDIEDPNMIKVGQELIISRPQNQTPVPADTPSFVEAPRVIQSLAEFEESPFCHTYHCRFDDSWSLQKDGTNNTYDIDVSPEVGVEATTLKGKPTNFGLIFFGRQKLSSEDLQLVFSFLSSIYPGIEVDTSIKSFIKEEAEVDVFQICQAESIPFGSMQIWAGKVIEQTVSIGESCP